MYILSHELMDFNDLAEMRGATVMRTPNDKAYVLGRQYDWDETSTSADDGLNVIKQSNTNLGRWVLYDGGVIILSTSTSTGLSTVNSAIGSISSSTSTSLSAVSRALSSLSTSTSSALSVAASGMNSAVASLSSSTSIGLSSANSAIGSVSTSLRTTTSVSASQTLNIGMRNVRVANGATSVTLTMPSASGIAGAELTIGRHVGSTGTVTIGAGGSQIEALNGAMGATTTLAAKGSLGANITLYSNGTDWHRKLNG